jgi:hypothetical protein
VSILSKSTQLFATAIILLRFHFYATYTTKKTVESLHNTSAKYDFKRVILMKKGNLYVASSFILFFMYDNVKRIPQMRSDNLIMILMKSLITAT